MARCTAQRTLTGNKEPHLEGIFDSKISVSGKISPTCRRENPVHTKESNNGAKITRIKEKRFFQAFPFSPDAFHSHGNIGLLISNIPTGSNYNGLLGFSNTAWFEFITKMEVCCYDYPLPLKSCHPTILPETVIVYLVVLSGKPIYCIICLPLKCIFLCPTVGLPPVTISCF